MAATLGDEIKKFALSILENGQIVTCTDQLRIDKIRSGSIVAKEDNCDRFRLLIPFGGATLRWEVVFNSHEPHFPPDIIFSDSEADFEPNLEEIPSLQYWNPENPNSLTGVVKELLEQYKQYHYELVKTFSEKVAFEFDSVQKLETLTSMEVYVHRQTQLALCLRLPKAQNENRSFVFMDRYIWMDLIPSKITETQSVSKRLQIITALEQANFLIKLPIDLTRLPPYLVNRNPGEDSITLFVSYEGHYGTTVTPKVFLSPRVEHAFSEISSIKYPSWTDGDECLVSYILAVHGYFNEKIDELVESFERRRNYVAAFLSSFGTCVLEYDAEAFSEISFLMELEKFFFILTIEIGRAFPEEQPVFIMKSIYHCFSEEPYHAIDDAYPYSPRWSPDEMANRARSYLCTAVPLFKAASMKNRPYHPPGP